MRSISKAKDTATKDSDEPKRLFPEESEYPEEDFKPFDPYRRKNTVHKRRLD